MYLPASGGDGAWLDGKVSRRELSLTVVRSNQPKMLAGWSQQALRRVQGLLGSLAWANNAVGGQRAPNPILVIPVEHGKPVVLPAGGRKAARPTEGAAGKGRGRKRTLLGNGADTGCNILRRESGPTSLGSIRTRAHDPPT
jgi:hypothetical protein